MLNRERLKQSRNWNLNHIKLYLWREARKLINFHKVNNKTCQNRDLSSLFYTSRYIRCGAWSFNKNYLASIGVKDYNKRYLSVQGFREDTHKKLFDHEAKNHFFFYKSGFLAQKLEKKMSKSVSGYYKTKKKKNKKWHGTLSHQCRDGKTLVVRPLIKTLFYVCLPLHKHCFANKARRSDRFITWPLGTSK